MTSTDPTPHTAPVIDPGVPFTGQVIGALTAAGWRDRDPGRSPRRVDCANAADSPDGTVRIYARNGPGALTEVLIRHGRPGADVTAWPLWEATVTEAPAAVAIAAALAAPHGRPGPGGEHGIPDAADALRQEGWEIREIHAGTTLAEVRFRSPDGDREAVLRPGHGRFTQPDWLVTGGLTGGPVWIAALTSGTPDRLVLALAHA